MALTSAQEIHLRRARQDLLLDAGWDVETIGSGLGERPGATKAQTGPLHAVAAACKHCEKRSVVSFTCRELTPRREKYRMRDEAKRSLQGYTHLGEFGASPIPTIFLRRADFDIV